MLCTALLNLSVNNDSNCAQMTLTMQNDGLNWDHLGRPSLPLGKDNTLSNSCNLADDEEDVCHLYNQHDPMSVSN